MNAHSERISLLAWNLALLRLYGTPSDFIAALGEKKLSKFFNVSPSFMILYKNNQTNQLLSSEFGWLLSCV